MARPWRWLAALLLVAAIGCKGDMGPMGPQGPQGEQGPGGIQGLPGEPGPGTKLVITKVIDANGHAAAELPAEAGTTANDPPALTCYLGEIGGTVWLSITDGWGTTYSTICGLVYSSGRFYAVMTDGVPGWVAAFVVVY